MNDKQDDPELYEIEKSAQRERTPSAEGNVDLDDDDDDMASQLNPDAAEFVPTSPPRTNNQSPFSNGSTGINNNIRDLMMEDEVIAQSPRKGAAPPMDDITLPLEDDFSEISKRPAEIAESPTSDVGGNRNGVATPNGDHAPRPGSSNSQCSYQELNMKEAMHGDEKQEMAAEIADATDEQAQPIDFHVSGVISEREPMNTSFYDNDTNNPFVSNAINVDMNAVQPLPLDDSSDENETLAFDGNHKPNLHDLLDNDFMGEETKQEGALENGSHYVIQDTEFGMDPDVLAQRQSDLFSAQRVEALTNFSNLLIADAADEPSVPDESIKPELSASIAEQVHELATQVTSVLDDFDAKDKISSPIPQEEQHDEYVDQSIPSPQPDLVSHTNVINTEEFSQNACDAHIQQSAEYAPNDSTASDIIFFENVPSALNEVPVPAEPKVDVPAVPETEPQTDNNVEIIAAASVAAVTAVAAAAATIAAKPAASPKSKPDVKKPEVKSRTTVGVSAPATKKPAAAAPLKSARPAVGAATAKTATSPAKLAAAKPLAPATARTARAAPPTKAPIEKKSTLTSTTTAARKPLTNGSAAAAGLKKTTTTTTVTKTTAGAKPLVATTKTAAARANLGSATGPKPATTTKTTTTTTKPSTASARPASLPTSKVAPITR